MAHTLAQQKDMAMDVEREGSRRESKHMGGGMHQMCNNFHHFCDISVQFPDLGLGEHSSGEELLPETEEERKLSTQKNQGARSPKLANKC